MVQICTSRVFVVFSHVLSCTGLLQIEASLVILFGVSRSLLLLVDPGLLAVSGVSL